MVGKTADLDNGLHAAPGATDLIPVFELIVVGDAS